MKKKTDVIKAPPRVVRATLASAGFSELPTSSTIELVIRAEAKGAPLRDLANYLLLVDRFYGRQDQRGFRSYAQRSDEQLEITETKAGSIEIILSEGADFVRQNHLVLTWVLLRGLPHAARTMTEAGRNIAGAYHDYQAGRLARAQRRAIERAAPRREPTSEEVRAVRASMRAFLDADPRFTTMRNEDRRELARLLADAYLADEDQVKSARQFAEERVMYIALRINGREL